MDQSAVLRRSFSNPSETCFQEGDPLRALGESVSFGRYMSESLAWEKWSTFSHNRYLEEAEKYSKPGSVAKMKAYFEAHYKRIGAKKQANDAPSSIEPEEDNVDDSPEIQDNIDDSPSLSLEAAEANTRSTVHEFPVEEAPDEGLPPSVVVTSCGSSSETKELQNGETKVVETGITIDTTESPAEAHVCQCKDPEANINVSQSTFEVQANQLSDALGSDTAVATPETKVHVEKEGEKETLGSKSKQKSAISSIKKATKSNVSKLSSSFARLATPIRPKTESNGTSKGRKSAKQPIEEKKPVSKMLHMSTNSDDNLIKKASPASHKTQMGKVFSPLGTIIRESFASSPAPSRASVNSVLQHPSATPRTEFRNRSRTALEKSFDKSRKLHQKLQSPSVGNMKSSMQSPARTVFSSFNFRTEERAAKRREFFQKRLEKEAENMQLLNKAKQVKPKTDFRKSCINLKANPTEDVRTEVLTDNMKKIPPRRTESPKHRSKPASDLALGACSHPPPRSIGSKLGAEKTKTIQPQSSTPLIKKKRHENASPNIL